eukprot:6111648-Heterocapsa_arctica.AAC.1
MDLGSPSCTTTTTTNTTTTAIPSPQSRILQYPVSNLGSSNTNLQIQDPIQRVKIKVDFGLQSRGH